MDVFEFITQSLNGPQGDAVRTIDGPLLIFAGAGSGKTRVLTHRMAHIIAEGAARPDEILCVTFTNKAAKEMESRTFKLLSDMGVQLGRELWISTFHSFCVRVLRQHLTLLGYKPFFVIYDSSDQMSQIKKVMNILNINDKIYPAKNFQYRISQCKMMGMSPQDLDKSSRNFNDKKVVEVYQMYEAEMKKANALDFDDLLLKTHELFKFQREVLEGYREKLKYIMVDEYQDTNHIQYLLIKLLAQKHRNLCVVGDEDQSIYSWRGADISNILNFEKDFPETKIVKLEENYRSSGNIVRAATAVIKNNSIRKDKTLFTNNRDGEPIVIHEEITEYDEARFVAKQIEQMMALGEGSYNDYAVFYRTNAQSRVLEEQLRTYGIPYRLVGGIRFYERMEVKDVLTYMKLALNSSDDVGFKRVVNVPARGIGKTTMDKIEEYSQQNLFPFYHGTERAIESRLFNAGTAGKLRRFLDLIEDLKEKSSKLNLLEFYLYILEKTEYLSMLKADKTEEAESRVKNLEELHNAMTQFQKERGEDATIQSFLEEMALVSDADTIDQDINSVTLMTLHISKGLEFPFVFVVGLEENLFPSGRAAAAAHGEEEDDLEEERRLAYVGFTRARERLFLTYTQSRRVWGQEQFNQPSRFLREIPKENADWQSLSKLGGGFASRHGKFSARGAIATANPGGIGGDKKSWNKESNSAQDFPDYENSSDLLAVGSGSTGTGWVRGIRVRHPTFGVGSIYSIEGSGEGEKISVLFTDNSIKKFVAKYARLERV